MFLLPTSNARADDFYSFEVDLDGVSYLCEFYWNERAGAWFLSLALEDGTKLISGVKVTAGTALFSWYVDRISAPRGRLLVVDTTEPVTDPTRYDLASDARCVMVYLEQAEVALFFTQDLGAALAGVSYA